ncbi:MAG: hypothetical protein JSV48_04400, partial [Bradyrhizobium sp.]
DGRGRSSQPGSCCSNGAWPAFRGRSRTLQSLLPAPWRARSTARPSQDSIPSSIPYLTAPDLPDAWRDRLGAGDRPRIGLVWSGNAAHLNDRNRSIRADLLAPLLARDAVFVGLQTEIRESDKAALGERSNLILAGQSFADFTDTAAVVAALDLVITVDTSSAHLAGALGRPVWLLLPHVPDWRWLLDREDSPWYPTARLFRQDASRDWGAVIARVDRVLAEEFPTTS